MKSKSVKKKLMEKIPQDVLDEIEHFKKTRIPRCPKCKTDFKQLDNYIWEPVCDCSGQLKMRLSVG